MTALPHLIHADSDKPHRCPSCWRVAVDGERVQWGRVYTCCGCPDPLCGCGQRFAMRPWLPYRDEEPGHPWRYTFRRSLPYWYRGLVLDWRLSGPRTALRRLTPRLARKLP